MELLLNLAWVLLIIPAFWLWRGSRTTSASYKSTALQCLLALGCGLVMLFPVISATDDLRVMRTEMEESQASKRSIRQAANLKAATSKWQNPLALASSAAQSANDDVVWSQPAILCFSPLAAHAVERAARAPPHSLLG